MRATGDAIQADTSRVIGGTQPKRKPAGWVASPVALPSEQDALTDAVRAAVLERAMPEPNSGCWLWTGFFNDDGYGRFLVWRCKRKFFAHRLSWVMHNGPIPAGLVIDHICRNRGCINPAHLRVVTRRENNLAGFGYAGRLARRERCLRGHEFDLLEIRDTHVSRRCRECRRINDKNRRAKKAAANA